MLTDEQKAGKEPHWGRLMLWERFRQIYVCPEERFD